ncbi:MAG: hypothetical protein ACJ77Z_02770, partial [Thermoleophilaceae bacterium]
MNAALLVAAVVAAILTAEQANWDLPTGGLLLVFAIASDQMAMRIRASRVRVSGSFLAIVVAMVLLGGAPAAAIGVLAILAGWLREREKPHFLLANLMFYSTFPVVGGLVFTTVRDHWSLVPGDAAFAVAVMGVFVLSLGMNFLMVAAYIRHIEGRPILETARRALFPLLTSDLVAAVLAVGVSYVTLSYGYGALALFGILLLAFQHLLAALLTSEERAEDLQK